MRNFLGRKKTGAGRSGNVMTPLNWMCGISEAIFLPAGVVSEITANRWLGVGCFIVAVCIIIFYGVMYVYFALRDPDRLQTEEYNLTYEEMKLQLGPASREIIAVQATEQPADIVQALPQTGDTGDQR